MIGAILFFLIAILWAIAASIWAGNGNVCMTIICIALLVLYTLLAIASLQKDAA